MEIKPGDELLDMHAAAARLGLSYETVRLQARKGILRAQRLGSGYVTTTSEVERYRREHRGKPGRKPNPPAPAG